jgi:hypothetical protein
MAKAKYNWIEIQKAYECGKSVDELVIKYDVEKKTLQNKISEKKWEVSGNIKATISDLKESVGKISGTLGNNPDKFHIIAEDVINCINEIAHLVEAEKIVKSATILNLSRTVEYLKNNTKQEKIGLGEGMQGFETVGLGSNDYKNLQDAIDKASITLGVNQRHASSAVINNANVQQEVNLTAEQISIAIANGLPN